MADQCLAAIHLCRVRATRLDAAGFPLAGPNNSYVSDKPMTLGVTPIIEAGQDKTLVGGCDCIIAEYRGRDKLKRFDLDLDLGVIEPALLEMLLGNSAITDPNNPTDIIGNWFTHDAYDCSAVQPNVCFEGWQTGWDQDAPATDWPYVHWIWPSTFWMLAAQTLQNDFLQPKVTSFSRGNPNWGVGIYGDLPEAAEPLGGFFFSTTIPDASCGYLTQSVS